MRGEYAAAAEGLAGLRYRELNKGSSL